MMKYFFGIFAAALFISISAQAQETACPVTVTDVRNIENGMFVLFDNTGTQTITSYEFAFIFVDLQGQQHVFPLPAKGFSKLKTGRSGRLRLPTTTAASFLYPQADAYLVRATFADGTTWSDDGTHACGATAWQE